MRKYENVDIKKLKPYENNARTHSEEQVEKIANSIKEFGFINPVIIDGDYGIIAGHGRVLGAQKLGMKEVPCLSVKSSTNIQGTSVKPIFFAPNVLQCPAIII